MALSPDSIESMSFTLRIEGFGLIENYEVNPTDTVKEVKEIFCDAAKLPVGNVVPFVNTRLLIEAHTLEEAHVNEHTTVKMYDVEMAKMIISEEASHANKMSKMESREADGFHAKMRIESSSSATNFIESKPPMAASLRPWNGDNKSKGFLGLF